MEDWHSSHTTYSQFVVANFICFPIFSWVFLLLLFVYINHRAPDSRISRLKAIFRRKNNKMILSYKLRLQDEFTLSSFLVLLAVSLSAVALHNARNTAQVLNEEIGKYFDATSKVQGFRNMYSLVIITLIEDVAILSVFLISPALFYASSIYKHKARKFLARVKCKRKNYKIINAAKELTSAARNLQITSEGLTGSGAAAPYLVVKAKNLVEASERCILETPGRQTLTIAWDLVKVELNSVKEKLQTCKDNNAKLLTEESIQIKSKEVADLIKDFTGKVESMIENRTQDTQAAIDKLPSSESRPSDLDGITNLLEVAKLLDETLKILSQVIERIVTASDTPSARIVGLTTIITNLTLPNNSLKTIVEKIASYQEPEVSEVPDIEYPAVASSLSEVRLGLKATEFILIGEAPTVAIEAADLIAANAKLDLFTDVQNNLNRVKEDLNSCGHVKLNRIAFNLITAAAQLTTLATSITTAANNIATTSTSLAATLTTVAANLETPILFMIRRAPIILKQLGQQRRGIQLNPIIDAFNQLDVGGPQPAPRASIHLSEAVSAASDLSKTLNKIQSDPLDIWWWIFCKYSTLFPLCCLLNHLNYIIIAFIHNLYHATSVAIVYGVIIIFLSIVLDRLPHALWNDKVRIPNSRQLNGILLAKFIAVLVLLGYITMDILIYFFLPIEDAFEDAANNFISIYSTTIVFFTGLIAFLFLRKSYRSQIQVFTEAMDDFFHKNEKEAILDIKRRDWKQLGTEEKDVEVAKGLLKKIV